MRNLYTCREKIKSLIVSANIQAKCFFNAMLIKHLTLNGSIFSVSGREEKGKEQKLFSLKPFPGFFNMGGYILTLQLRYFPIHLNLSCRA